MTEVFTETRNIVSLFCQATDSVGVIDEQDLAASEPRSQKEELAGTQPLAVLARAEACAPKKPFFDTESLPEDEEDKEKVTEAQKFGVGHNKYDAMIAREVAEKESLTKKKTEEHHNREVPGSLADNGAMQKVLKRKAEKFMGAATERPAKKQRLAEQPTDATKQRNDPKKLEDFWGANCLIKNRY
jgi:hypothetical protein